MSMNVIDGRQKKRIRVIESVVTAMGWLVMLTFALQIILSILLWYFNLSGFYRELLMIDNIPETIKIVFVTLLISGISFAGMYLWGRYNLKKFGPLKRRTFPKDTTTEEVAAFFNLPPERVKELQGSKEIVLEKTIV